MTQLSSLLRHLDKQALAQLRDEASKLHIDNEELRSRLMHAEQAAQFWQSAADFWRRHALSFQAQLQAARTPTVSP